MYSRKERNELLLKVANRGAYLYQLNRSTFQMKTLRGRAPFQKNCYSPTQQFKRYEIHIIEWWTKWVFSSRLKSSSSSSNFRREVVVDEDLLLQCIYISACPRASIDKRCVTDERKSTRKEEGKNSHHHSFLSNSDSPYRSMISHHTRKI